MGAQTTVATTPGTLVRAPATYSLHQTITVTNVAATLVSLLSGGALPAIPTNPATPVGRVFAFGFVDLSSENDSIDVRYTCDGQTTPTSTLGFVVSGKPQITRIPVHPSDVKLISTGANVTLQVYLGISGTKDS